MSNVRIEKVNSGVYNVFWSNSNQIGHFALDVDGYYYYYSDYEGGHWSDYELIEIGTLLKELNKPYDDSINEYFSNQKDDGEIEPPSFEKEQDDELPLGYEGYRGTAEYNDSEELWYGKFKSDKGYYIEYDGETYVELIQDFEQAVHEYLMIKQLP